MPGKKTVRWDTATRETIMAARQSLEDDGMRRPPIRSVLYRLMSLPGWSKKHYTTLCRKLGAWRDSGLIPFGLFSDDSGGDSYRPLTDREIAERIAALKNVIPAKLGKGGWLHAVFVEHAGMVDQIAEWLDFSVPVVSSQGEIRREHLHSAVTGWFEVVNYLKGKGVKVVAIVDYDKGGQEIYENHERWLRSIYENGSKIQITKIGVTRDQIREAGLPLVEDHQFDGWVAAYGPRRFREELRRAVGL